MSSATLRDIAAKAGVAKSTVSIALQGDARVARATRERVQQIARELGYCPNPVLSALGASARARAKQKWKIACLNDGSGRDAVQTRFTESLIRAEATRLGYDIESVSASPSHTPEQLASMLWARGVTGLVLPPILTRNTIAEMDLSKFCVVSCGATTREIIGGIITVDTDIARSLMSAWERVKARGYRRVGIATFAHEPMIHDDRVRIAIARFCAGPEAVFESAPFKNRTGFLKWVKKIRPDAVIGINNGPYFWLKDAGYRIPEDIGYAALNQDIAAPPSDDKISGLQVRHDLIAQAAVEILDHLIRHGRRGLSPNPQTILIEPTWQDGDSLRPETR